MLKKINPFENLRSMTNIYTQQTARKAILKRFGRRFKNCAGEVIFKIFNYLENV